MHGWAQNSLNLGAGLVPEPWVNQAINLANGAITTTTTPAAVTIGDDYFVAFAMLTITSNTATSLHVQIFGSDTNSNITTTGTLIADFGVQTSPGIYFLNLSSLAPSVIPGSGPTPQTGVYAYEQVLATVAGTGTVNYSVTLFI